MSVIAVRRRIAEIAASAISPVAVGAAAQRIVIFVAEQDAALVHIWDGEKAFLEPDLGVDRYIAKQPIVRAANDVAGPRLNGVAQVIPELGIGTAGSPGCLAFGSAQVVRRGYGCRGGLGRGRIGQGDAEAAGSEVFDTRRHAGAADEQRRAAVAADDFDLP